MRTSTLVPHQSPSRSILVCIHCCSLFLIRLLQLSYPFSLATFIRYAQRKFFSARLWYFIAMAAVPTDEIKTRVHPVVTVTRRRNSAQTTAVWTPLPLPRPWDLIPRRRRISTPKRIIVQVVIPITRIVRMIRRRRMMRKKKERKRRVTRSKRDAEMEQLEKEYLNLRNEEQNLVTRLRRHKDEDALKGQAMKNQKALWDKTLEFRFLLQKIFSPSTKLPRDPVRSEFCRSNEAVDKAYADIISSSQEVLNSMLDLQEKISDQVGKYMRDPSRMIKRMQLRRPTVGIIGEELGQSDNKEDDNLNEDGDPELLDDSEFYQQLLKEFLESCNLGSSESMFYAMRRMQPKKRKAVDHHASKSRKIRYHVHKDIVNFMAPIPMNIPPMAPKLFENLFGRGNQQIKSSS